MTGLDPASDEIISFATVTVSGGNVRLDDARYELVRPRRMPDWDTIRIHGLREVDLEEAPPLEDRMDELLDALTGRPIVAHVAEVERSFLEAALVVGRHRAAQPDRRYGRARLRRLRRLRGQRPRRHRDARSGSRRPGALARPSRASAAPRRRRRADHGPGVHRARHPPRRADPQTVGSLERTREPAKRLGILAWLRRSRGDARGSGLGPDPLALGVEERLGGDLSVDPATEDLDLDRGARLGPSGGRYA